jgi:hypothetical protein
MLVKVSVNCVMALSAYPHRLSDSLFALPKERAIVRPAFANVAFVECVAPASDAQAGSDVFQILLVRLRSS